MKPIFTYLHILTVMKKYVHQKKEQNSYLFPAPTSSLLIVPSEENPVLTVHKFMRLSGHSWRTTAT